jgi:hypothetical protein
MGEVGVLAEKAPVLSSSRVYEAMPMDEIGQRLLKINKVCVSIIEILG